MAKEVFDYKEERQLALIAVKDRILENKRTIEYLDFKKKKFKGLADPWIDISTGVSAKLSFLMFRESQELRNMQAENDQMKICYMDKYWQKSRWMLNYYKKHSKEKCQKYLQNFLKHNGNPSLTKRFTRRKKPAKKVLLGQDIVPQDRFLFIIKGEIKENFKRVAVILFCALPFLGMAAVVSHIFL